MTKLPARKRPVKNRCGVLGGKVATSLTSGASGGGTGAAAGGASAAARDASPSAAITSKDFMFTVILFAFIP